ncbi:MAG: ABC transporter ATP-binding protein [Spirochaetia bacterium]|jgi:ABC-type lipoprotein export system ATPase subunit|nr:ABC transporter ATP-binding protein [Spirochaetia bacterium]
MELLRVKDVSMIYGHRAVLDNVSLSFEEGKIIAITGRSGAGKSTLLGIISGLQKPHKGSVYHKDKDIFKWMDFKRARFRNRTMGFVFQFFNLFPDMTAYDNILYPVSLNRKAPSGIKKEIEALAELLGITEALKRNPATLSGGERQRVAIARAVINNPSIILADEPTGNLDEAATKGIIDLLITLKKERGLTTIIATHDETLVKNADINYHLEDGKITVLERAAKKPAGKAVKKKPNSSAM